jgi:hypothetical protein
MRCISGYQFPCRLAFRRTFPLGKHACSWKTEASARFETALV